MRCAQGPWEAEQACRSLPLTLFLLITGNHFRRLQEHTSRFTFEGLS